MATITFTFPFDKLAEKMKLDIDTVVQKVTFDLFTKIIKKSPVDTGRFRGNWNVSQGAPDQTTTAAIDTQRAETEVAKALTYKAGSIVYLVNALPYAVVLEYGLYPNPPKKGTWLSKGQMKHGAVGPGYFKFSQGGYSIQAPQGMVRVTALEFDSMLRKAMSP